MKNVVKHVVYLDVLLMGLFMKSKSTCLRGHPISGQKISLRAPPRSSAIDNYAIALQAMLESGGGLWTWGDGAALPPHRHATQRRSEFLFLTFFLRGGSATPRPPLSRPGGLRD